jgi:hypothetical protein
MEQAGNAGFANHRTIPSRRSKWRLVSHVLHTSAPCACHAWATAQANEFLLATPSTSARRPANNIAVRVSGQRCKDDGPALMTSVALLKAASGVTLARSTRPSSSLRLVQMPVFPGFKTTETGVRTSSCNAYLLSCRVGFDVDVGLIPICTDGGGSGCELRVASQQGRESCVHCCHSHICETPSKSTSREYTFTRRQIRLEKSGKVQNY